MIIQRIFLLFLGFIYCAACWPAETQYLYLYNTPPPLNTDASGNLSDRLATLLSEYSGGKYQFKAIYLPRKRLDLHVANDKWEGAVIWANPDWFDDHTQKRYLWSQPLATDYNLVLSHKQRPIEYVSPMSLNGLKLGGVLGHVYSDFDTMINNGGLIREDTGSFVQNLFKLKFRRVDVIFMPASALDIYRQEFPDLDDWLYVAKSPRNTFQYYAFCSSSNTAMIDFLNKSIAKLQHDTQWQSTLKAWRWRQDIHE